MADPSRDDPADLLIQPTGNGVTDLNIEKLEDALADGTEDTSIEMPIPDDEPTKTQA